MQSTIDFLKYRWFSLLFASVIAIVSVFFYFFRGGFRYNIDFAGGAELRISFEKPIEISVLRGALSGEGWSGAEIQSVGNSGKDFLVRVGVDKVESSNNFEEEFGKTVDAATPGNTMRVENVEMVGAQVGSDIKWAAVKAVLISLLMLLIYIMFRYRSSYAVGAVVALAHDILSVIAFVLIAGIPVSVNVLAAVLAILGYSLNDTIVIFSRIRSNRKKMLGRPLTEVINLSLSQTMSRTILTTVSTALAVGAILVLGGETLRDLTSVMMVGILLGTYSSIFIASSIFEFLERKAIARAS